MSLCLLAGLARAQEEQAVAYVNGTPIPASRLEARMKNAELLNTQAASGAAGPEGAGQARDTRNAVLSLLVEEEALLQAAAKLGITGDDAAVRADADQRTLRMISAVEDYVHQTYPTLAGAPLDEQVDALLALVGADRETYRHMAEQAAILAALDEKLAAQQAPPSPQAIKARYQQLLTEQKALFDGDENAFEAALLQDHIVVYRPVDLKLIQKLEFLFDAGAAALIRQTALVDEALAEEMRSDQYARLDGPVEATYAALLAGELTFAEAMEARKAGSSRQVNYFHETSTRFEEAYYTRAAAFETVGEVSTPYAMPNGYALLYYAGDLPAAPQVPLAEVEDRILQELSEAGAKRGLEQAKQAIVAAAEVVYFAGDAE